MSLALDGALLVVLGVAVALAVVLDLTVRRHGAETRDHRRRIADLESAVYHLSLQEPAPHARHPIPTYSDN